MQVHVQGPDQETVVAVPVVQRLVVGAMAEPTPFAEPQWPATCTFIEQVALVLTLFDVIVMLTFFVPLFG